MTDPELASESAELRLALGRFVTQRDWDRAADAGALAARVQRLLTPVRRLHATGKAPENPGLLAMRTPGTPTPAESPQEARSKGVVTGEKGPIVADGFVPRHGDGMIEQSKRDPGEQSRGQSGAGKAEGETAFQPELNQMAPSCIAGVKPR